MFSFFRTRRFAFAAATAIGVAALGAVALTVTPVYGRGDPDPQADSSVAVCSDVPVHAWVTMNVGTATRPDNKKVDYDIEATGHGHDPFDPTLARGCDIARRSLRVPGGFQSARPKPRPAVLGDRTGRSQARPGRPLHKERRRHGHRDAATGPRARMSTVVAPGGASCTARSGGRAARRRRRHPPCPELSAAPPGLDLATIPTRTTP
jgi:hypothetical protein